MFYPIFDELPAAEQTELENKLVALFPHMPEDVTREMLDAYKRAVATLKAEMLQELTAMMIEDLDETGSDRYRQWREEKQERVRDIEEQLSDIDTDRIVAEETAS